jgi:beta-galactosidase
MNDDFMVELYDKIHATLTQQKFRKIAPMPVGVVFIQAPEMTEEEMRSHFRLMKKLGFTCLKQVMACPGTPKEYLLSLALDEGIIPWWYGEGGWEEITDKLLEKLGIPLDTPIGEIRTNGRFLAYQEKIFRNRIDGIPVPSPDAEIMDEPDIPYSFDMDLREDAVPYFIEWLKEKYGTVECLSDAWNRHHAGLTEGQSEWKIWEDVEKGIPNISRKEYRHFRDILRFKADVNIQRVRQKVDASLAHDRNEPVRAGGEMGLFLPFAARATDMEGIAEEMARGGSFYPSIHLAWHFEEVDFEVARSIYMQASIAHDWFKGGWSATWESTGGPQQLSGGKGWRPDGAAKTAGFTVDEGVMTQLMLSYLAAGFKGFGMWCWNARTAGWEAGEFALLDRNRQPTERAIKVGQIGQAARRYRDELWKAHKEPLVGVFTDFDSEAIWAAVSVSGRDKYKRLPIQARIGVSRALINSNIPWEYVTGSDLRNGLAGRYKIIYLPAVISLNTDLLEIFSEYVRNDGRLVMDMPSAWYDEYGRLLPTAPGTIFDRIFGCSIRDYQYSSNVPRSLNGDRLKGFVLDLGLTHAKALATYDNGKPAITEAHCGDGTAVILGYEASLMCYRPGNALAESWLTQYTLGKYESPYQCKGALVYRLAAPSADHYFLINDDFAKSVVLDTRNYQYISAADAVTQEEIDLGQPILISAYSGRWIRCQKV